MVVAIEFFKNTIFYNKNSEIAFATQLKNDISLLAIKRDMNYVNEFLVKLLNSEACVPVCMHPFNSINNRWLIDGNNIIFNLNKKILFIKKIIYIKK